MADILTNVNEEEAFKFWDATNAKNVRELHSKIKIMSPYVFNMYVNNKKNDFASWIEKNYSDFSLAEQLRTCPRKGEIVDCLYKSINEKAEQKSAKIDSIFKKQEKQEQKLLEVVSKQGAAEPIITFIPEKPFYHNFFNKSGKIKNPNKSKENLMKENKIIKILQKENKEETAVQETVKVHPNKRVLLDEVISGNPKLQSQIREIMSANDQLSKIPFADTLKIINKAQKPIPENNSSNSNVFKEPVPIKQQENRLNVQKFNPLTVNDIIQKIKEAHR